MFLARFRSLANPRKAFLVLLGTAFLIIAIVSIFKRRADSPSSPEGSQVHTAWTFRPEGDGFIASSPLVTQDRVYIAVAFHSAFRPHGKLFCLNRKGEVLWSFNDSGRMKQVFSSPCLADGLLYLGEGLHQDFDCKLYCVEAATGKKRWEFTTQSHTESSPCVAGGKVFFGAGDDGVYCLEARTGTRRWQFNPGFHVDASPVVVGQRLYVGSGFGDTQRTLALICLNTETGRAVWQVPVDLPSWASPVVCGEHVYFGLGNGNFLRSDPRPAGAVVCLQTRNGRRVWRRDLPDGVLGKCVVNAESIYAVSRNGFCYALDWQDGSLHWQSDLGSPIVASLALACPDSLTSNLIAIATEGCVSCLDCQTGKPVWTFDLREQNPRLFSSPAVTIAPGNGRHRQIFFGAGLNDNTRAVLYCVEEHPTQRKGPS
jgi:outer membrane protein assembly factor BamB